MREFDIEAFIDRSRISPIQWITLILCILICFIDGFDMYMVGKIAPAIAADFGAPTEAMTFLFVCQQIGLAIGAFAVSPLADRIGRRSMLIFACLTFGGVTLISVAAQSLTQLSLLRGIGGLFMAAGMPMALALISEVAPKRRRATFIAIAMAGFSAGSAASGAVAAWLIDLYGWRSGFWIGGMVPLLCLPLLIGFVPESLKLRAERNPSDPSIARTLRRIDPTLPLKGDELFVLAPGEAKGHKARLFDIFTGGRARMTILLWAACTLSMTNIALMGAWLPTFFQEMAGIPIQEFALIAMIAYIGGIVGTLVVGALMDRFSATSVLCLFYVLLAAALMALAWVPFHSALFIVVALLWSFFQTGGQGGLNTYITQIYSPRMRSTGLGWAGGAGRVGGIVAPIAGGFALAQHFSLHVTLGMAAILPLSVALLALLLGYVGQPDLDDSKGEGGGEADIRPATT